MTSRSSEPTRPNSSRGGRPPSANRLRIHARAWVAPNAVIVGDVSLGERCSIWYGCVLRGDLEPIRIGDDTNVQDLSVVHVDHGLGVEIGRAVTIAHNCVIHGCTIGDESLIGMGAVLLSGSSVGRGALVAAGAVVREGFHVPDGTVAVGVPARIRGEVDEKLRKRILDGADDYVTISEEYRSLRLGGGPHGGGTVTAGDR